MKDPHICIIRACDCALFSQVTREEAMTRPGVIEYDRTAIPTMPTRLGRLLGNGGKVQRFN